jgi:hypothetical protein
MRWYLLILLVLAAGCEDPYAPGTTPQNNEFSGNWAGTYTGIGLLTCTTLNVNSEPRSVTVRFTDLNNNWLRVELFMTPSTPVSPLYRVEGEVTGMSRFNPNFQHNGHHFITNFVRSGNELQPGSGIVITDTNGNEQWRMESIRAETN